MCAGDHGAGDPGIALGAAHPTAIAAHEIAGGTAALAQVARAAGAPIVLVDAGAAEAAELPPAAIRLGRGPSRNLLREPAMTVVDASLGLEAGIALAVSLADAGLDVLAVGAIGVGARGGGRGAPRGRAREDSARPPPPTPTSWPRPPGAPSWRPRAPARSSGSPPWAAPTPPCSPASCSAPRR